MFDRFKQHSLLLQPDKCNFMQREIKYLGLILSENQVELDPEKVDCDLKFPRPSCPKDIKSFLGLAGYYHRFIADFARIAKPLNNLSRNDVVFDWQEEQEQYFRKLNDVIKSDPILQYSDFNQEFNITTDACKFAQIAI